VLFELIADARADHQTRFGVAPTWVASAPGRVNLIGDHTDYTGGFAMPFAIDRYTVVVASPSASTRSACLESDSSLPAGSVHQGFSEYAQEQVELTLGPPRALAGGAQWHDYVVGVLTLMAGKGYQVPKLDISIHSNLPVGSGLSSSASLELAVACLVESVCQRSLEVTQKMLLCQQVEHEYALVPCGLMDQFTVCAGKQDQLLQLDCLVQTAEMVAIDGDAIRFLIIDSQVRHQHSGGGYTQRRDECFAAQQQLGCSLRDATAQSVASLPAGTLKQRAAHVVSENSRVATMADAMRRGDYAVGGRSMNQSHQSLRDDFAVSCPEVDQLVSLAQQLPGVFGARMTGGGFGGSVVAMVAPSEVDSISKTLASAYYQATGLSTQPLPVVAVNGAQAHNTRA
jgi:galactokinase